MDTDQLVQVVLDPWQVGERADGHQAAQSKIKELVAEERNEPAITMLWGTEGGAQIEFKHICSLMSLFTNIGTFCPSEETKEASLI